MDMRELYVCVKGTTISNFYFTRNPNISKISYNNESKNLNNNIGNNYCEYFIDFGNINARDGVSLRDKLKENNYFLLKKFLLGMLNDSDISGVCGGNTDCRVDPTIAFDDESNIYVEPILETYCANELTYGTVNGLKVANVSYMGPTNNKCGYSDSFGGYTFINYFNDVSFVIKARNKECNTIDNEGYDGCGYFKYTVGDVLSMKCESDGEGGYYDSDGKKVGYEAYMDSCYPPTNNYVCTQVGNDYYGIRPNVKVNEKTYKDQCFKSKLIINKVDQYNNLINSEVKFQIYKGSGCKPEYYCEWEYKEHDRYIFTDENYKKLGKNFPSLPNCDDTSSSAISACIQEYSGCTTYDECQKTGGTNVGCNYYEKKYTSENNFKIVSFTGSTDIQLSAGNYSIKEKKEPKGYIYDDTCHDFEITSGETTTLNIVNKKGCEAEFDGLTLTQKNSMLKRIDLYKKYKEISISNGGGDFTNLLNLDITKGKYACTQANCTKDMIVGCVSAKNLRYNITDRNLSCYNSTENIEGKTAYCGIFYKLSNNFDGNGNNYRSNGYYFGTAKSGQLPAVYSKDVNKKLVRGNLTKTCYLYGESLGETEIKISSFYDEYIKNEKLLYENNGNTNNILVRNLNTATKSYKPGTNGTEKYTKITYEQIANYGFKPVYSKIGNGEIQYSDCPNCKFLGYGFPAKLTEYGRQDMTFSIETTKLEPAGTYTSNSCSYSATPELVRPNSKLYLEFRILDVNNPFPGKSGTVRKVGTNWRNKDFDVNGDGTVDFKDRIELDNKIKEKTLETKYDITKDGKVDNKDLDFIKWILKQGNVNTGINKNGNNLYIKYILEKTNNSYDKNKTGTKYKITLTPDTIKEIREYNNKNNYDDYDNLKCKDGENCVSEFIEELKEGKVNGKTVSSKLVKG